MVQVVAHCTEWLVKCGEGQLTGTSGDPDIALSSGLRPGISQITSH
jgi:hypothetical protein